MTRLLRFAVDHYVVVPVAVVLALVWANTPEITTRGGSVPFL